MKKSLKSFILVLLTIVMFLSMTACGGGNNLQEKYDDLLSRLEQQEEESRKQNEKLNQQDEKLNKQEEKIKELQEKDKELESKNTELEEKNAELEEKNQELEQLVDMLTNAVPHEIAVVGHSIPCIGLNRWASLLRSKTELNGYLKLIKELYEQYRKDAADMGVNPDTIPEKWSMSYDYGRFNYDEIYFDEDTIAQWYDDSYFESKALVFCVFHTSNNFVGVKSHHVWEDNNPALQIWLDCRMGIQDVANSVIVILEVNKSEVENFTSANLEITRAKLS